MRWPIVKLGDCMRLINGRAYLQHELLDEGTPIIRIQNLNGGERWYYSNLELPAEKYCTNGDLLFAWSATFGPYVWRGEKSIYHYHIWKIEPFSNLDKKFAYQILLWITNSIKRAAHGASMLHMTKAGMEKWEIPLPPLAEQQRIAALLDAADNLVRFREAAIEKLDQLAESVFVQYDQRAEEIFKLKDVAEIVSGATPKTDKHEFWDGNIRWVTPRELSNLDDIYLTDTERYISAEGLSSCAAKVLPKNSVLLSSRAPIGHVAINSVPMATNQGFKSLIPNEKKVICHYLYYWLKSKNKELQAMGVGATFKEISKSIVSEIPIRLPPLSLQAEFEEAVIAIRNNKNRHKKSINRLKAMFNSIQHQSFSVN
jgi:type I restriction enzyme S subunit